MDIQSNDKPICNIKKLVKNLPSMQFKENVAFSMSVTDKKQDGKENVCFYKKITSDTECNLLKLLVFLTAAGFVISMICSVCSIFKK